MKRLLIVLCLIAPASLFADEQAPFARWKSAISAFEKQPAPASDGALFVGSSSIRLWDLEKSFPGMPVINRGFGGSEVADSVHFADRIILPAKPRVVVLYAGDNDIAKGKTAQRVSEDFAKFVKVIHKELPQTRILYLPIKPSISRWKLREPMQQANAMIRKQCDANKRLVYVDNYASILNADGEPDAKFFKADGLHLNDAGYAKWNAILTPVLKEAMRAE